MSKECIDCVEFPDDGTCDKCGQSILSTKNAFVPKTITLTADEGKRLREFLDATEPDSPTCNCEWCKKRRAVADIKLGDDQSTHNPS